MESVLDRKIKQLEEDRATAQQLLSDAQSKLDLCYELQRGGAKIARRVPSDLRTESVLQAIEAATRPVSANDLQAATGAPFKTVTSRLSHLHQKKLVARRKMRLGSARKAVYHYVLAHDKDQLEGYLNGDI